MFKKIKNNIAEHKAAYLITGVAVVATTVVIVAYVKAGQETDAILDVVADTAETVINS